MSQHKEVKLVTTHQLLAMKQRGEKISMEKGRVCCRAMCQH